MLSMMKSEFYRISKGKSIYITTFFLIAFALMMVATQSIGNVGVMTEVPAEEPVRIWTGYQTLFNIAPSFTILQYFFLPIIIAVVGADFSNYVYKNTLTKGASRITYYASKLIVSCILCFLLVLIYMLVSVISATILNGFGGTINVTYFNDIIKLYGPQLLILFALIAMATAVLTISKKTVASTVSYLVIPMIIQVVFFMIKEVAPKIADTLQYFELFSSLGSIGANALSNNQLLTYSGVSVAYFVIATCIGIYCFIKSDLS